MSRTRPSRPRRVLIWLARGGLLVLLLLVAGVAFLATRDYDDYFHARHGELVGVELQGREQDRGHTVNAIRLTSSSGLQVELKTKQPEERAIARRPLVVILGGSGTGREAVHLVPDTRGAVVAAFSYPFDDRGVDGWRRVGELPRAWRAIKDTPAALMLGLDYLLSLPFVDPRRVELVGVSLGGPFACIAGAVETRFTRVWCVHAGGKPHLLINESLKDQGVSALLRVPVARSVGLVLRPLAPERFVGRIAPRPFVLANGEEDHIVPAESIAAVWASANEPKTQLWLPGGHVLPGARRELDALIEVVFDHAIEEDQGRP